MFPGETEEDIQIAKRVDEIAQLKARFLQLAPKSRIMFSVEQLVDDEPDNEWEATKEDIRKEISKLAQLEKRIVALNREFFKTNATRSPLIKPAPIPNSGQIMSPVEHLVYGGVARQKLVVAEEKSHQGFNPQAVNDKTLHMDELRAGTEKEPSFLMPMLNKMSYQKSSFKNLLKSLDLRYKHLKCRCNSFATIKIIGPIKNTVGKIFCNCPHDKCGYFMLLDPISVSLQKFIPYGDKKYEDAGEDVNSSGTTMKTCKVENNGPRVNELIMRIEKLEKVMNVMIKITILVIFVLLIVVIRK